MRKINSRPDFIAAIDAARGQPFAYGVLDCATFVADYVLAMTDVDPMDGVRGTYSDEAGAIAAVPVEFADHIEWTASMFPEIDPSIAQTGDIAVVPSDVPGWSALAVFSGPRIVVMRPDGLGTLDRSEATRAFKVE